MGGGQDLAQSSETGTKPEANKEKKVRKKGFMNIYFAAVCVIILLASMSLTGEAMKGRLKRKEYEAMLQFDYRLEGYFLLLKSGSLLMTGDTSYGSLESYEWTVLKDPKTYIQLTRMGEEISLKGYFLGKLRKTYEIKP